MVKFMKKILTLILALVLCSCALCSCGANAAKITGAYKIENNLYYATLVDKAYNPDDGYSIEAKGGKTVLFLTHRGISNEMINDEIGELRAFMLSKSNFDDLCFGETWQDSESAKNLRKANKAAWKAEKKGGEAFYILFQREGDVLIAAIKTKEGVKSCAYIRKIIK